MKKTLLALATFVALASLILNSSITGIPEVTHATPPGKNYDHIVIIALENQYYSDVFGNGTTGTSTAPFLSSLLGHGATIPSYHSFGSTAPINGCSSACYVALTSGSDYGISNGYSVGSLNVPNIIDSFRNAGLSYKLYCENSCPRGPDHFPFLGYADTANDPNIVYSTGPLNPEIVASMNSASPADFYWFTPDDSHNMHDNSISSGDGYLKDLLVGSGSISAPAPGSILSSNIFQPGQRTELYIWWDEYDPSPNIQLGFGGAPIKQGFVSSANNYDEYATLHTIEDNWGLPVLTANDASAPITSDIFGTSVAPISGSNGGGSGGGGGTGGNVTRGNGTGGNITTTTVACVPSVLQAGNSTVCTATVSDPSPPFYGYGGILAVESQHYSNGAPASKIFPGEQASNAEIVMSELAARGYNGVRVSVVDPGIGGDAATFHATAWQKTLAIADHFNFVVIGDQHDYGCPDMSLWNAVFAATPSSMYPNVLFEFVNEPHCNTLAQDDQSLITTMRNNGDDRWVVLGCNNDCTPSGSGNDLGSFPIVNDPVNHVYYDFHEYYFYQYHAGSWSTSDAIAYADQKFAGVQDVINTFGRQFLGTEFGADTGCGSAGPGTFCPPDQVIQGSCGWSPISLAYLTELTTRLQGAGIGYMVWTGGDWSDGPVGATGCVDNPSFGPMLPFPLASNSTGQIGTGSSTGSQPTGIVSLSADSAGGVFNPTTCTLTGISNSTSSTCRVMFTPESGNVTITATYLGDATFTSSSGRTVILITSGPSVNPDPSPSPGIAPLAGSYSCILQSSLVVQCIANVSGGTTPYTYSWNFGDGTILTGNPVTHAYNKSGHFTIALTVTDNSGQSSTLNNIYFLRRNKTTLRIM